MNCPDAETRLTALLHGELDRETAEALDAHIASCPSCAERLSRLRETAALLDGWEVDVSPSLRPADVLAEQVLASAACAVPPVARLSIRAWMVAGAAGALAGFVLGFFAWTTGSPPPPPSEPNPFEELHPLPIEIRLLDTLNPPEGP
jgi:anti-sigma factor RsiW